MAAWHDDDAPGEKRAKPPAVPRTIEVDPYDIEDETPERKARSLPWLLAALLGAGWAAQYGRGLHDRQQERADLQAAREEAAEFRTRAFHTDADLDDERKKNAMETDSLKSRVAEHGSQRSANEKLIAALKAQLDSKTGEVSSEANQIAVNLVDQILFKSGDAELSAEGKKVLDRVGKVLKKLTDKQILIGGHTDARPIHTARFPSNWELSSARAVNVARYLADVVGVDPAKLAAAGFSQFHPRGRSLAKNRRIEILLTPAVFGR